MLDEFRTKLQQDLGFEEPLGVGGQESFSLIFDTTNVTVSAAPPGFRLSAALGAPPQEESEILYAKLLRGDLFFQATQGAILGLDEAGRQVTLQYLCSEKASYKDFKAAFEDFLNTIDFWKGEMREHAKNPLANF